MEYRVNYFRSYSDLPDSYAPLLEQAAEKGFFHSQPWFEFLMEHMWQDDKLRLYAVEDDTGRPLLFAPLRLTEFDGAAPYAKTHASIAHIENFSVLCLLFNPILDKQHLQVLTALLQALRSPEKGQKSPTTDVLRLWPVETGSELEKFVGKALVSSGFWIQRYTNSFNRFEDTTGLSFDEYFAKRNSKFRYNVRRRRRNLDNTGTLEINIYAGDSSPEDLQRGIDDYILGTVESWQSPASMASRSMLHLIRLASREGCMRLGVLKLDGRPVAGQFWLVSSGVAHCMRQAYHEGYKKWALGVVLTSHVLKHVLDQDHVDKIDFGLGNEDYKEKWMKNSRDYSGFMAFNPRTPRGLFFATKHIVGQPVKRFLLRVLRLILRPLLRR